MTVQGFGAQPLDQFRGGQSGGYRFVRALVGRAGASPGPPPTVTTADGWPGNPPGPGTRRGSRASRCHPRATADGRIRAMASLVTSRNTATAGRHECPR